MADDDRFYVKTLRMQNFRCFEDVELGPFDPHFNLLVGENGAGKSSVLVALANLFRQFGKPELDGPGEKLVGRDDVRLEHRTSVEGVTSIKLHLPGSISAKAFGGTDELDAYETVSDTEASGCNY